MTETEVLCLDLSNRPGALADVAPPIHADRWNSCSGRKPSGMRFCVSNFS